MKIDYLKINGEKEKIDEALDKLIAGEVDEVKISNIPSGNFEEAYDVDCITDFNGWQCDWWSKMHYKGETLAVMGCAFYGMISVSKEECED